MLTRTQLGSLFRFSALIALERLGADSVVLPLVATDAHDRVGGSDAE